MKIVAVVQARAGSSRLPRKILLPLAGKSLLERMIERVLRAHQVDEVVVATSVEPADDVVASLCKDASVFCYRGSLLDLLDRHYQAGVSRGADAVVKIPSDCPLIDPLVIDRVLGFFRERATDFDFVSNLHPATYPDGNDVEVMPMRILEQAWKEAIKPHEREHTTPFIWDHPERFRLANLTWESGLDFSMTHRWTIDYQEDYDFICAVYDALYEKNPSFGLEDILALENERPEVHAINAKYAGINWYRNHLDELKTVSALQTKKHPL